MWGQKNTGLFVLLIVILSAVPGCGRERHGIAPCTVFAYQPRVALGPYRDKMDVLFVIDNSGSMREEQESLARQIPRMMRVLASGTPDNGAPSFLPARDLRVGVISTDMGTGGHAMLTCTEPHFGDDGILRATECAPDTPAYLSFRPGGGGSISTFGERVQCIAGLGTNGCGFRQPLDALLKAVTPNRSDIGFVNATRGHAGGENRDFVREDSLLVILMLTNADDCSAMNPDIFNPMSRQFPGDDLSLRCHQYGDPAFNAIHPVERYVDGLLDVRAASAIVFGAIVGIPPDLAPSAEEYSDYDAILSDPRMVETPAVDSPGLVPSCDPMRGDQGLAFPPRRIVEVAQQLELRGVGTTLQSICQAHLADAMDAILQRVAENRNSACLRRPMPRDLTGRVTCELLEILPLDGEVTRCAQLPGRIQRTYDSSGAEVCLICQSDESGTIIDAHPACQAPGVQPVWFYETDVRGCPHERNQRISYHSGAEPPRGALIRTECLQRTAPSESDVSIGTRCFYDAAICEQADQGVLTEELHCEPISRTCQMACDSQRDCDLLLNHVCLDHDSDESTPSLCTDPTCGF